MFLTAAWRNLLMLNFPVDPAVLNPLVPNGTELDFYEGRTFVSLVGFEFLHTRVAGIPALLHRDFEEVNLRFYVRRKAGEEWRRGVVFVREIVPKWAIAFIARTIYGEPYAAMPMRRQIADEGGQRRVRYEWKRAGRWESISGTGCGANEIPAKGSEPEFITEHYWGYTALPNGRCNEYQVEHPQWQVRAVREWKVEADVKSLYGERFHECLSQEPSSAFLAEGSGVSVRAKNSLK